MIRLVYKLNYLWLDRRRRPRPVDYRLRYDPERRVDRTCGAMAPNGHLTLVRVT